MATLAHSRTPLQLAQVAGLVAIGGYVLLVEAAVRDGDNDRWAGLVVVPLLVLLGVHLICRASRGEPWLRNVLLAAFALKALATGVRYVMAFVVYDGLADARVYHEEGVRLAAAYRAGDFGADLGRDLVGTGFIRMLTGALYAITTPSVYVAFAFFAFLGFWGLYFLYRAFQTGVPDGDHRRYALLVLLLPSMLFWPSGLGKDAWMTLGIGLAALGSARLLTSRTAWLGPLAAGCLVTGVVRPHITAALVVALGVAVAASRLRGTSPTAPLVRAGAIVVVAAIGLVAFLQTARHLGIEEASSDHVEAVLQSTQDHTAKGGSQFDAQQVNSLTDIPWATISVLFRPFPFEAANVQSMVASAEGIVLLVLLLTAWRRVAGLPARLRRQPYLLACLVYTALFIYAFSTFSNFGILTRQRVQVLPFVLVLLALPLPRRKSLLTASEATP